MLSSAERVSSKILTSLNCPRFLAIDILCFCPPDSFIPLSPTKVFSLSSNFSISSFILLFLLNPAVSIKIYSPLSFLKFVSIASLVVPGISLTILLFSPIILLTKEDFPTFGFPIKATFVINPSSSFSFCLGKCSYI